MDRSRGSPELGELSRVWVRQTDVNRHQETQEAQETQATARPVRLLRFLRLLMVLLVLAPALVVHAAPAQAVQIDDQQARWVQMDAEGLRSSNPERGRLLESYLDVLTDAERYGYNGVLLRVAELVDISSPDAAWEAAVLRLTSHARQLGLEVTMSYGSVGRCGRMLLRNTAAVIGETYPLVNLAAAYPTTTTMVYKDGVLTPASQPSFITNPFDGGVDVSGDQQLIAKVRVPEAGAQYRATLTLAGEFSDAGKITLRVWDATTGQVLNELRISPPSTSSQVDAALPFNAFVSDEVRFQLVTGDRAGLRLSASNFAVTSAPTLNLVNRGGVIGGQPAASATIDGQPAEFRLVDPTGRTVVSDTMFGRWDASLRQFSVAHAAPALELVSTTIPDNTIVTFSAWHGLPHRNGLACSWNDPAVHRLIGTVASRAVALGATGHMVPYDEVRSGGFEPFDDPHSAVALANSIEGVVEAVRSNVGQAPVYVFSDMLDTGTNAIDCYAIVKGSLRPPLPVPAGVTVVSWDESGDGTEHFLTSPDTCGVKRQDSGFDIANHRAKQLAAIAPLTTTQLIGAYYDIDDVEDDYDNWKRAVTQSGATNVGGVVYTAWFDPARCPAYPDAPSDLDCATIDCLADLQTRGCLYEHLEEFAGLWWGGPVGVSLRSVGPSSISIDWNYPADGSINGAQIWVNGQWRQWVDGSVTEFTITGLEPGSYEIEITATRNNGGPIEIGSLSSEVASDQPFMCGGQAATIVGSDQADELRGTSGDDVIWAGGGDDTIFAMEGNDVICGGGDDDVIYAGEGDDIVYGRDGDDEIYGGPGHDEVLGGEGLDRVWGGPDRDVLFGGGDNDRLVGGLHDDRLSGDAGDDELLGGIGNDWMSGGANFDTCDGGEGWHDFVQRGDCELVSGVP